MLAWPYLTFRQSPAEVGRNEKLAPSLATVTRTTNRHSLYNLHIPNQDQEAHQLLQYNIYDATPDHSILKHGLAKSLSNFHIGEWGELLGHR